MSRVQLSVPSACVEYACVCVCVCVCVRARMFAVTGSVRAHSEMALSQRVLMSMCVCMDVCVVECVCVY